MNTMVLSHPVLSGTIVAEPENSPGRSVGIPAAAARACALDVGRTHAVVVREAASAADMEAVWRLTHDAYVEQGYCAPQPDGRLIHYPHLEGIPETTVLVAEENGEIVGTNSLTLDGPAGLHVDADFTTECDRIRVEVRAAGKTLGASWRIATKSSCRSVTAVVKSLIRETVRRFVEADVETVVFTFNPRHERIYKRLLNMSTVARHGGTVHGLNNAPAVFMRWEMATCPDQWLVTPAEFARRECARMAAANTESNLPAKKQSATMRRFPCRAADNA